MVSGVTLAKGVSVVEGVSRVAGVSVVRVFSMVWYVSMGAVLTAGLAGIVMNSGSSSMMGLPRILSMGSVSTT